MKQKAGMLLGLLCVGSGVAASELDIGEKTYVMPAAPAAESPSLKQKILKFISLPKPQTERGRLARLKEMGQFLLKNKGCLSGEGCSVRTTLAMNYLLGVAVELALYAMNISMEDYVEEERAEMHIATFIIDQAFSLGYDKAIHKSELSYFACLNVRKCSLCLLSGKNCSIGARRMLFFHAGRWTTMLTAYVIKNIKMSRDLVQQLKEKEKEESVKRKPRPYQFLGRHAGGDPRFRI